MTTPDGSIVICTRNRAESLAHTLEAVDRQDAEPGRLECVVIDNGSTDSTREVVEARSARARVPLRYVFEPRTGLSHARNTGLETGRGRIAIFLDDDAWPEQPDWAQRLAAAYADPRVAAAGGDLVPRWPEGGRPDWIADPLFASLGLTLFDRREIAPTHYPRHPWGANLSFDRERARRLGGFSPRLGRQGALPLSGEETELCLRLEQAGAHVVYVPGARVVHDMTGKDLRPATFERQAWHQGVSEARIEAANFGRARLARAITSRLEQTLTGALAEAAARVRGSPRDALRHRVKRRVAAGYLAAIVREGFGPGS